MKRVGGAVTYERKAAKPEVSVRRTFELVETDPTVRLVAEKELLLRWSRATPAACCQRREAHWRQPWAKRQQLWSRLEEVERHRRSPQELVDQVGNREGAEHNSAYHRCALPALRIRSAIL
jgi:hypothetical protein